MITCINYIAQNGLLFSTLSFAFFSGFSHPIISFDIGHITAQYGIPSIFRHQECTIPRINGSHKPEQHLSVVGHGLFFNNAYSQGIINTFHIFLQARHSPPKIYLFLDPPYVQQGIVQRNVLLLV